MLVLFTISIVHNDGLWQMVQWMSCCLWYHFLKQAKRPFRMDDWDKPKNVDRNARMVTKHVHCGQCQHGD